MLDAHQARTAIAEGQSQSPERPAPAHPAAHDAVKPAPGDDQHDAPATEKDGSKDDQAAAQAALLTAALPTPLDVPVAPVATESPAGATQMVVAGGPPTPVVQVVTPAQADVTVGVPAAAAVPTAPAATPANPATAVPGTAATPATPAAAAAAVADAAPATESDAPALSAPAAPAQPEAPKPAAASTLGQSTDGSAGQQPQADGKAAQTLQQARAAVAYARPQAGPHQAQAQAAQPANAPAPVAPATSAAPATAPATPTSAATPVPLARAAEAVEHVLMLASSRGVTHARIALRPADLGAVDVHIRSTADGLVARVVAHSPEAVQTLQNAAGDLRRSLEEQGLNVLNLDIGQPGESGTGRAGSESSGRNKYDGAPAGSETEETTQTKTLRLPTGVLVDVLA
jgi:flagellar hook-length control protein FliK